MCHVLTCRTARQLSCSWSCIRLLNLGLQCSSCNNALPLQEEKERQRLESLRAARQKQAGSAERRPLMIRTGKARTEGVRGVGSR